MFFSSIGHFSHIRIFLHSPFASVLVFYLSNELNVVSLKEKHLKEPSSCQRADVKIMNK